MYAHSTDTGAVKAAKIRALTLLVSKDNVKALMREFKVYCHPLGPTSAICSPAALYS